MSFFGIVNKIYPKSYRFGVNHTLFYLPVWKKGLSFLTDIWQMGSGKRKTDVDKFLSFQSSIETIRGGEFALIGKGMKYRDDIAYGTGYKYERDGMYFRTFMQFFSKFVHESEFDIVCPRCKKHRKEAYFKRVLKGFCKYCTMGSIFYDYYSKNYLRWVQTAEVGADGFIPFSYMYKTFAYQPIQPAILNSSFYRRALSRAILFYLSQLSKEYRPTLLFKSIYPLFENKDFVLTEDEVYELLKAPLQKLIRYKLFPAIYHKARLTPKVLNLVNFINRCGWQEEFADFLTDVHDFIYIGNTDKFHNCRSLERVREYSIKQFEIDTRVRKKSKSKKQVSLNINRVIGKKVEININEGEVYGL